MRILLFFTILLSSSGGHWSLSDYERYNSQSFFEREDIHTKIDLNQLDKDLLEAAIFFATNEIREKKRKSIFLFDPILQKAARGHSESMAHYNFFDHINRKEKKFKTAYNRIEQAGGGFVGMAENIARVNVYQLGKKGTYFVKDGKKVDAKGVPLQTKSYKQLAKHVVDKWMKSTGHRKNILADNRFLGCGISNIQYNKNGLPELLITQNFGEK